MRYSKDRIILIILYFIFGVLLISSINAITICYNSVDCNDNNEKTYDECINPGKNYSFCNYSSITCLSDANCGFTGFVSQTESCYLEDLYKDFTSAKCINPGTKQSYCDIDTIFKFFSDCGSDYCENYNFSFCKDGNVYKNRICHDRGCTNNMCRDETYGDEKLEKTCELGCFNGECRECLSDNDCPSDIFKEAYCSLNDSNYFVMNDLFDNYCDSDFKCKINIIPKIKQDCGKDYCDEFSKTYCKSNDLYMNKTCYDKSCSLGICSSKTYYEEKFIKKCEKKCYSGACIICSTSSECNDNDARTWDYCVNANKPESFCVNEKITCLSDIDCGVNVLSNLFCGEQKTIFQNIIFRNDTSFKCENKATNKSYCKPITTTGIIKNCGNDSYTNPFCRNNNVYVDFNDISCVSGGCKTTIIPILNNTCGILGCYNGYCKECTSDSLCKKDYYENYTLPYCKDHDLYKSRTLHDFKCSSYKCKEDLILEETRIEDCSIDCKNNLCVPECFSNSDCKDGKECYNNKCEKIICKKDSDCGYTGLIQKYFCKEKDIFDNYIYHKCNNPGTPLSNCSFSKIDVLNKTCSIGCYNAECKECNNDSNCKSDYYENYTLPYCKDNNIYKSRLMHDFKCSTYKCSEEVKLIEEKQENCKYGCKVEKTKCDKECYTNSDCKDGKECYNNKCEKIICKKDSACGFTGPLLDYFCIDNNIFDIFKKSTCINPGTPESFCQITDKNIFNKTCTFGCKEGTCKLCEESDEDKKCNNTKREFCYYDKCTLIKCFVDSECGESKYKNQRYCSNYDVYDKYELNTCINPGKPDSFCKQTITDELVEDCERECDNGICINPLCRINLPVNDSIIKNQKVDFKINSYVGELKNIQYYDLDNPKLNPKILCGNCDKFEKSVTMDEGSHNILISCIDKNLVYSNKKVSFYIDYTRPRVISTTPKYNAVINNGMFSVKYSEKNLKKVTLFYGNDMISKENCESGDLKTCEFNVNLGLYNGKYLTYYFYLEDIAGNYVKSASTRVRVSGQIV